MSATDARMEGDPDDIPERAVRDAVREMAVPGLSQTEAFVIAAVAANRARQSLQADATQTERYAAMNAAARLALTGIKERGAFRRALVGGIESLSHYHQMAMALRFQEGLSVEEIAAVMKLPIAEVRVLFAAAFEYLWDVT